MLLPRLRKNRFAVLGRAGLDLYADPPGTRIESAAGFSAALGGSAANIAVAIVRLGGAAALVSAVSADAVGSHVLGQLRGYGVDVDHVASVAGECRTSLAVVETRNVDCQSVIYRNNAADFQLREDLVRAIDWNEFGALVVTGTSLAAEPSRTATFVAIAASRAAGLPVVLDIDYRPYSWADAAEARSINAEAARQADLVIGNDTEFDVVSGGDGLAFAGHLAATSAAAAVYKRGEQGSIAFAGGTATETGIFRVKALKPTGAGDAFMGGVLTGLAEGGALAQAVLRGSAAAAIVVTRVGCAPAMPTAAELASFMAAAPPPGQTTERIRDASAAP